MNDFDASQLAQMDVRWLLDNGWTVPGNLAYRRLLSEFNQTKQAPSLERIEQVLMQYEADRSQQQKIIDEFKELLALREVFRSL